MVGPSVQTHMAQESPASESGPDSLMVGPSATSIEKNINEQHDGDTSQLPPGPSAEPVVGRDGHGSPTEGKRFCSRNVEHSDILKPKQQVCELCQNESLRHGEIINANNVAVNDKHMNDLLLQAVACRHSEPRTGGRETNHS